MIETSTAQSYYIPPDIYGDTSGPHALRRNDGQLFNTAGQAQNDIRYSVEQWPVGIHLKDSSAISFTLASSNDTLVPDTLYRVDMHFRNAKRVDPIAIGVPVQGVMNYYLGSTSVEGVPAFDRVLYPQAWDDIDVHIYSASMGPRMAFVVHPGGNPAQIKLFFEGQDSLNIDWQNALRLYIRHRWVRFEEAVAYQVTPAGATIPLGWMASYVILNGTPVVSFSFQAHDPSLPLVFQIGPPPMPLQSGGDPKNLHWSTFVGGGTNEERNY
ncbi:MAG: hypothetical protein KIT10_03330 [Flavobacteriales bacterium]|nr:hypothetical protein [Flavobacteriales bacterium]